MLQNIRLSDDDVYVCVTAELAEALCALRKSYTRAVYRQNRCKNHKIQLIWNLWTKLIRSASWEAAINQMNLIWYFELANCSQNYSVVIGVGGAVMNVLFDQWRDSESNQKCFHFLYFNQIWSFIWSFIRIRKRAKFFHLVAWIDMDKYIGIIASETLFSMNWLELCQWTNDNVMYHSYWWRSPWWLYWIWGSRCTNNSNNWNFM